MISDFTQAEALQMFKVLYEFRTLLHQKQETLDSGELSDLRDIGLLYGSSRLIEGIELSRGGSREQFVAYIYKYTYQYKDGDLDEYNTEQLQQLVGEVCNTLVSKTG